MGRIRWGRRQWRRVSAVAEAAVTRVETEGIFSRSEERLFGVVADELSFLHDYYFSSLPMSYSKFWLPILSICISLSTIGYCITVGVVIMGNLILTSADDEMGYQAYCQFWCNEGVLIGDEHTKNFGSLYFAYLPMRQVDEALEWKNGPEFDTTASPKTKPTCFSKATGRLLVILMWHIATSILEARHLYQQGPSLASLHKIAAIHLSRYCAYLVISHPRILSYFLMTLHGARSCTKLSRKDSENAFAGHDAFLGISAPKEKHQRVIELLSEKSKDELVINGLCLAKQLVELIEDEETA
uniref:DUF4220 domain-containing protein n=1 Tax=Leersia perrieri TaxID=77586 RepID=A0A0D9W2G1_9ORYZ